MIHTADRAPTLASEITEPHVVLEAVTGRTLQRVPVEGDTCLIGRAEFCDLQVDGPLVHSELHISGGALWIESAAEHDLEINSRSCRRLALRNGDVLRIGQTAITVRVDALLEPEGEMEEGVADLSALELCERIETEQAAVAGFDRQRLSGWEALLRAVEGVIRQEPAAAWPNDPRMEGVLSQLHILADKLAMRTQELAAQEAVLLESAGELNRAQDLMTSRLERVLQQFHEGELRASA